MKCTCVTLFGLFVYLFLAAFNVSAENRTLYWHDFSVKARLAGDGKLHIKEKQQIVFDGNWNGGERQFNVQPGQSFTLNGIYRIEPDGQLVALKKGNLSKIDHYKWVDRNTLRWRSRLPDDPPFKNRAITYLLDYSLSKILLPQSDNRFLLNHDFAFSKRSGRIETFQLELVSAADWQGVASPLIVEEENLLPGRGVVVRKTFTHTGSADVLYYKKNKLARRRHIAIEPAPVWLASIASLFLVLFLIGSSWLFYRHEFRHDRFKPLLSYDQISEEWLQKNVFNLLPETVGALWDRKTSGHEVAAVLARLVVEEKMKSYIEPVTIPFLGWKIPGQFVLHLELLQKRQQFSGYERELIDGFFIDGDTTDTRRIRKYYREKSSSFQPAVTITKPLKKRVDTLTKALNNPLEYRWSFIVVGLISAFFLLLANCFIHQNELFATLFGGFAGLIGLIVGSANAVIYRSRSDYSLRRSIYLHLFPVLLIILFGCCFFLGLSTLLYLGLFCLYTSAIYAVFYFAKTRDSLDGVALSKNLTSARDFFQAELKKQSPAIRDERFPYLLAFGLGPHVDAWSNQFGRSINSGYRVPAPMHSSGSSFTGGGGRFGG
ncbi:MAG: DUF2207 domain-containing protein, partial [Desulfobacterales bacterium]|nr:DUF2207 domain-containing protein [Desulfobacterales bacterium]